MHQSATSRARRRKRRGRHVALHADPHTDALRLHVAQSLTNGDGVREVQAKAAELFRLVSARTTRLQRFKGERWELFRDVISGVVGG